MTRKVAGSTPAFPAMEKLYIITRSDLPPGLRSAQLIHAFREFQELHPEIERSWYRNSNNIVTLEVSDEAALRALCSLALEQDIEFASFLEEDLNDQMTAIAMAPCAKRHLRRLPKAFAA